jgi:hypothetical protein
MSSYSQTYFRDSVMPARSNSDHRLDHCSDAKQYWRATLALTFALVCVTSAVGALAAIL